MKFLFVNLKLNQISRALIIINREMQNSFASVSSLLDKVIGEEVHNESKSKNNLYLVASTTEPIHFYDISKIKLIFPQDDLETYLGSNPQINAGSTICLQNCEIIPEYGKNSDVVSCQIESKNIVIEAGTAQQKKLKTGKIRLQVETDSGEIPLLASTRKYIRRMEKQEIARKQFKKLPKTDVLSFINSKSTAAGSAAKTDFSLFSDQIGQIDTESVKILQKLVHFVNKQELFHVLANKPLKSKTSKKAVRLMVVPNSKQGKGEGLVYKKKNYLREQIQELARHYENLDLEGK